MMNETETVELDIRRKSQELAVAWRHGRAAFVLDSLSSEEPLRSALIAGLMHDALTRWDPYDSRWPNAFRRALLMRSQGKITGEEFAEIEREYRHRFGSQPPRPEFAASDAEEEIKRGLSAHLQRIRSALASGEPIVLQAATAPTPPFLRHRPVRRRAGASSGTRASTG